MSRRLFLIFVAAGSAFLIATGAIAGVLIAGDSDEEPSEVVSAAARTDTGTGKGYLGLTVSLSAPGAGLRVASVENDGPADAAGVTVGDVVRAVEEEVVRTPEKLRSIVEARKPGDKVTLTYERGERLRQTAVTLGDAPPEVEIESPPGAPFSNLLLNRIRLGVRIEQIDAEVKMRLNLERDEGVVVVDVTAGSAAERAGLQPGDIFLMAGNTSVDSIEELQRAIAASPSDRPTTFKVLRGSEELTLTTDLAPQFSLEGLGSDILPPQVRERLQQQIQRGEITQAQLQQILRLYRARSENVRVGTVVEIESSALKIKLLTGEDVSLALNAQTQLRRGSDVIRASDLKAGELVMVLSQDGGMTAFSVNTFGIVDLN
ncbi:MAG: PDZ domain-containing protein [Dehalococcoidia bacterium]|nr:PDZ domain-containing protein [Dehalococcoidia bacterium]